MDKIQILEQAVQEIQKRNQKVEIDKKWETSFTRRILLILFTYVAITGYLFAIQIPKPFLNAIVPSVGFLLSTLTLPFLKKIWQKVFLIDSESLPAGRQGSSE